MELKIIQSDAIEIEELMKSFEDSKNADASFERNMVDFYLAQFPGVFPEEANDVVEKIKAGVSIFNQTLNKALSENGIDYVKELEAMGEGKSYEKRYEMYVNFLAALTVLDVSNFDVENHSLIESFDEIQGKLFAAKGEIYDDDINEVINKIADVLKNTTFAMSSAEMIDQLIEKTKKGQYGVKTVIRGSEQDVKDKMLASLVSYISYKKGAFEYAPDNELTAEQIAVTVCAGIEETKILMDMNEGIITEDNAIELIKKIGAVALYSVLTILSALPLVSMVIALGLFTPVAVSSLLCVGMLCGMILLCGLFVWSQIFAIPRIMDFAETAFYKSVEALRRKMWPNVKDTANAFVYWIRGLVDDDKIEIKSYNDTDNEIDSNTSVVIQ